MEEGEQPLKVDVDGMELHLDPQPDANGEIHTALPPRMESWRRRSVAGAVLTGIGLGLREALEPRREEPSIVVVTSGDPPTDLPVEADLTGFVPSAHVVKIRPWLMEKGDGAPASDPGTGSTPEPDTGSGGP
ncbi:MAG: hypothetical protein QOK39_127 [Acidimicrobiaceae bacterium]|nr:hypothetical protein [Acidimicrobiaceae bacterium]